jgi:Mn-containing catalase
MEVIDMFLYNEKLPIDVRIDRPDPQSYFLLDSTLHGTHVGLTQAMVYIRQAFMIHNETFSKILMRLAAKQITDMEILAKLIHLEHGEDDRYYDESNDDTPVFEYIMSDERKAEIMKEHEVEHHVNNDLTAAMMRDLEFENMRKELYEELDKKLNDEGAKKVFAHLIDSTMKSIDILKNTLNILTTHTELKEFGEGDTHESWDLDTGNYFDKPNPYFLSPDKK